MEKGISVFIVFYVIQKHQCKYIYCGYHITKYAEYKKLLFHHTKHPFPFKQYIRIFVILKILQIFTDVSVLSHYFFLQYSYSGSSKFHRIVCIYLQKD